MTPLLGVLFIPYRTSIIHPTLRHWTRKHRHRGLTHLEAAAGSGRSEPWRRTPSPPSRKARKPILPRAYSARRGPIPRSPPKTAAERCRAGASLGGEHLSPLAQSAKDPPPQSLLSERRPDAAEPTKNRSGAVSGRSEPWRRTPSPSRIARKILLPRAYSASGGPIPRSPCNDNSRVESVPFCVNRWDRPLRLF